MDLTKFTGHTPKPWQSEWPDFGKWRYIASAHVTVCPDTAVCRLRENQAADAALIAAAPDLLEYARAKEAECAEKDRRIAELREAVKALLKHIDACVPNGWRDEDTITNSRAALGDANA